MQRRRKNIGRIRREFSSHEDVGLGFVYPCSRVLKLCVKSLFR